MSKPVLYKPSPRNAVVALLTPDAYSAFKHIMAQFRTNDRRTGVSKSLVDRLAAGTMTFVNPTLYRSHEEHLLSHCGDLRVVDLLATLYEIVPVEEEIYIPFSSGLSSYPRLREEGFGPKPDLIAQLIADGLRALQEVREAPERHAA